MKVQYRGSGKVYIKGKEHQCDLYYNKKRGGILLKIKVKNEKTLGSFFEVPLELPHLYGQLENGFMFTLLQLRRTSMNDLVSYGITEFTFNAEYILCGIKSEEDHEQEFHRVEFILSDIMEWGEESVYNIGQQFELIRKEDDVQKIIYNGQGVCIKYIVRGSMLPVIDRELLKEHINIEQHGIIQIDFEKEEKLERFIEIFEKLKRLIEIAYFRKVNLEKVFSYSKDIVYTVGEKNIEYPIEVYGRGIQENKHDKSSKNHWWKWISLSELIAQNSFEHYFDKHSTLAPIIELFLEPFYVEYSSETRVFLNVVQALETYHSRFVTNNLDEFRRRVESLTENEGQRKALMAKSRTFITLESRLADLLFAEGKFYFDTGEIKHVDFPAVVAHTRNYFIHYDETIKEKHKILTEEELQFYNRSLLQMLEYYILLEVGFSDVSKVRGKLTERWGKVSQDLEILRISRSKSDS